MADLTKPERPRIDETDPDTKPSTPFGSALASITHAATAVVDPKVVARGVAKAAVNLAANKRDPSTENTPAGQALRQISQHHDIPGLKYERYNAATPGGQTREGHCLSVDSNGSKTFYFYDPKRNELLQLTDTGWKTVKPNKSEELGREIVEDILTEKVLTQNAAGGKVAIPKTQNLTDIEQKAILAEIRDAIGVASGLETQKPEEQAMLKAKENALSAMAKLFREGLNSQEAREFIRKTGVNPETFLKKYAELERVTGLEQRVLGDRSANPDLKNEISFWRRHLIDDLMSNSFHDDAKLGRKTRAVLRGTDTPESLSRVLKARGLNTQAV